MTVEQGIPALPYPSLWDFCENMPDDPEPGSHSSACDVPPVSGLAVDFGWIAKETKLASNWEVMEWALRIDGSSVDLEAFEWYEDDYPQHGEDNKSRIWMVNLMGLPSGEHKLVNAWSSDVAINDGFDVYQPGTYELVVNFTVFENPTYPGFSATAGQQDPAQVDIGLNYYTSEAAGLDFLLYLPDSYGVDTQQKWPLLVFLHGAHLRGATLELLMEEPFPRKLDKENDFPFIVIAPLGDGGFEFWDQDQLFSFLLSLLKEVQTILSVDANRIYLMGDGMGGNGVWTTALRRPEYFAALVPIGGYFKYPFEVPENICDLKDVPVWAFHGGKDENVPVEASGMLVNAINECGGNAQITVKTDMTIDILYNVYDDTPLYDWLLSHVLE
jgi:predicted esterase